MGKKCPKCRSTNTSKDRYAHDQGICYVCADCCYVGDPEEFREQTVFDHITESVEALAEKFVYFKYSDVSTDHYGSTIIKGGDWKTEAKAIAATVKELKKEAKYDKC